MAVTNNLKKQIDSPVWEWARFAPAVSAAASCTTIAENSTFHVTHGRYIYYMINTTNFWRYDTWSDSYMQLASPPFTVGAWGSMRFIGSRGYEGRVIAGGANTIQAAALFGNQLKTFDVVITAGTGVGQRRIITSVADPVVADSGTASAVALTSITDSTKAWQTNQWVGYQVRVTLSTGISQVRKIMYNSATVLTVADTNKYSEDYNANGPFVTALAIGSGYQIESSVITVDTNWAVQPDATSRFTVQSGGIYMASHLNTSNYELAYYDVIADVWYLKTANSGPISIIGTDGTITCPSENATVWDRGNVSATAASGASTLTDSTKSWTVNQWAGYYVRIFTGTGENDLQLISSNTATVLTVSGTWGGSGIDATSKYIIVGFDAGTATSAGAESQTASGTASSIAGNILTVGGSVSGTFIPGQILSGTNVGAPVLFSGTQTSVGAVVTVASTTNVNVGQVMTMISGTGTLLAGINTVISVNSNTTFTISQTPSVALAGANVFVLSGGVSGGGTPYISAAGATNSTVTVTVGSTTNLFVGMMVIVSSGTGTFVAGTTVTAVNSATTFTVSTAPSVSLSASAVVVGAWSVQTVLGTQISGTVGGAGIYNVFPAQTVSSTTITGTGVATITDSTKTGWTTNRWNNQAIRITGGTGKGQVRTIQGTYQTSGGGVLAVVPNWVTTPDNTSTYEIQADPDKIYIQLGADVTTGVYNIAADLVTNGRQEDYGAAAGVTVRYSDYPPIAVLSGSYANPTMTVTTVNNHNFKTGQTVTIAGDTGAGASFNNISTTITVTATNIFTYNVGASSASMTVPAQSTTTLTDASKNWISNQFAGSVVTYNTVQPAGGGLAASSAMYIIGNNSNTLFFAAAAATAPVQAVSRYVITSQLQLPYKSCVGTLNGGLAIGTQSTTTIVDATKLWTSAATTCSSASTTVTLASGTTSGLQVGMYLAVTAGTGAFVNGGGTNVTSVQVATIASSTTFTITSAPTTGLSGATVTGTFWPTNAFVNRRVKFLAGTGQFQELAITANTGNTLTFTASTAGVTGATPYVILQGTLKGAGIQMDWAYNTSDTTRRGSYLFCARGGTALGFDRLNIQTDSWDFMSTSPQTETLTTGSMYAYDGADRLYFTKENTQHVYYLDLDKSTIHAAGMYPYTAGTSVTGNRMNIFITTDGLKYMWLNRHSNVECFKQLIFY